MPGFKVLVTGRKPVENQPLSILPQSPTTFSMPIRLVFERVELIFPGICPCCGEDVQPDSYLDVSKVKQGWAGFTPTNTATWQVPYCQTCLQHIALKQRRPLASVGIEIAMILAAVISVFSLVNTNAVLGAVIFIGILTVGLIWNAGVLRWYEKNEVRPVMKDACTAPGTVITYLGWDNDGTRHTFLILKEFYAKELAKANQSNDIYRVK